MNAHEQKRLALRTASLAYAGICGLTALISWLDTYNAWTAHTIAGLRAGLARAGLAGQGHCWLCGMSHAFRALWRGDLAEALRDNSHSVLLFGLMLAGCVAFTLATLPWRVLLRRRAVASGCFVLLLLASVPARAQFGLKLPGGLKLPSIPGIKIPGLPEPQIPGLETLFKEEAPVSTNIKDVRDEVAYLDDYTPARFRPLTDLKRGPHGGWLLHPGLYSGDIRTYCLHAGTYGPTHGSGYLYAPLKGKRSGIIRTILHNSADHPELAQHDVQSLIWAIEARAKFNALPQNLQTVASTLLPQTDILELNGVSLDYITDQYKSQAFDKLSTTLRPIYEAQNNLRGLLTQADAPFSQLERVAVLLGDPPKDPKDKESREIPRGRWTLHPGGFFVRYIPSSYSRTTLQLYVPERFQIQRDAKGRILSVMDSTGRGVQTDYNDAVAPLATSASSCQGYSFSSIRLLKLVHAEAASDTAPPLQECKNVGWTYAGVPNSRNVQAGSAAAYPGSDARLQADAELLQQMEDYQKNLGNHNGGGDAAAQSNSANCVDLANYRAGIKDALGNAATPEALDFLTNAWQSEMAQWASSLQSDAPETNTDGEEFDPSGDVATPGDTRRQRLGQSPVDSNPPDKNPSIKIISYQPIYSDDSSQSSQKP